MAAAALLKGLLVAGCCCWDWKGLSFGAELPKGFDFWGWLAWPNPPVDPNGAPELLEAPPNPMVLLLVVFEDARLPKPPELLWPKDDDPNVWPPVLDEAAVLLLKGFEFWVELNGFDPNPPPLVDGVEDPKGELVAPPPLPPNPELPKLLVCWELYTRVTDMYGEL